MIVRTRAERAMDNNIEFNDECFPPEKMYYFKIYA